MSKTIFITGASSGIGRATAQLFHERGWNVVATMRSPEKAGALADMERVLVARLDVLDGESIERARDAALERFGRVDVLLAMAPTVRSRRSRWSGSSASSPPTSSACSR